MRMKYNPKTEIYTLSDIFPEKPYDVHVSFRILPDRPYFLVTNSDGLAGVYDDLTRENLKEIIDLLPECYMKWQLQVIYNFNNGDVDIQVGIDEVFRYDSSVTSSISIRNNGGSSALLWYTRFISSYMVLFKVTTYEEFIKFLDDFKGMFKDCIDWNGDGFYMHSVPVFTAYEGTNIVASSDDFQALYCICQDMATTYHIEAITDITSNFNSAYRGRSYLKKKHKYKDNILVQNLRVPSSLTATDDFQI